MRTFDIYLLLVWKTAEQSPDWQVIHEAWRSSDVALMLHITQVFLPNFHPKITFYSEYFVL